MDSQELIKYAQGLGASDKIIQWITTQILTETKITQTEAEKVLDYLISDKSPTRLDRATWKQMKVNTEKWEKSLIKKGENIQESEGDTQVIMDFNDGFKIVQLIGARAFEREGYLMRHCVSSYFGKDDNVYSLRDEDNMPHATMSRSSQQIKGKGNGSIHPEYIRYVVEFLEYLKIDVRDEEMKNLGYINIERILEDIDTSNLQLFRDKYFYLNGDINFKDKEGNPYCNFALWNIFPLVSVNKKTYEIKFNFNITDFISGFFDFFLDRIKSKTVANEHSSTAVANEHSSTAVANEHSSTAVANEYSSTAVARGNFSTAVANEYSSTAVANGSYSTAVANEHSSTAVANEHSSTAVANEHSSTAVANEHSSTAVANGSYSTAVANGSYSTAVIGQINSLAIAFGNNSKARGVKNSWLILTEWQNDDLHDVQSVRIDGKNIKENVFYALKNKEIIEAQ